MNNMRVEGSRLKFHGNNSNLGCAERRIPGFKV